MSGSGSAADVLVYAPNGELRAAVEVKAVTARPPEWIAQFLSNLLELGVVPERVPYFLLATADAFYLWGNNRDRPLDRSPKGGRLRPPEPDRHADAARVLAPHLQGVSLPLEKLSERSLMMLVSSWLYEATDPDPAGQKVSPEHDDWLSGTGFLAAVRGCRPVRGRADW